MVRKIPTIPPSQKADNSSGEYRKETNRIMTNNALGWKKTRAEIKNTENKGRENVF